MPAFYVRLRLAAGVENIANPREGFAVIEVVRVDVVVVRFSFKRNATVRPRPVATVVDEEHEPRKKVECPHRNEAEFSLLEVMYALVSLDSCVDWSAAPDPPPEANRIDFNWRKLREECRNFAVFVEYRIFHTCPHVWRHCVRMCAIVRGLVTAASYRRNRRKV